MNNLVEPITVAALLCAAFLATMLMWSILVPSRRLWPTGRVTVLTQIVIWTPTLIVFIAVPLVGIIEWNMLDWSAWVRFGIGLPIILAGNVVVWQGVFGIGMDATSGAQARLKTDGLYRYTRNPQYLADMGILIGWAVFTASPSAWIIAASGVLALALAPFAEEPWLEEVYGDPYRRYCKSTPRFFGISGYFTRNGGENR